MILHKVLHLSITYNFFISYLLWHSNIIKNLASIYYLTASVVRSLGIVSSASCKILARAAFSSEAQLGKICP